MVNPIKLKFRTGHQKMSLKKVKSDKPQTWVGGHLQYIQPKVRVKIHKSIRKKTNQKKNKSKTFTDTLRKRKSERPIDVKSCST